MPISSKFPGYDLVGYDEPFAVGDYYYAERYKYMSVEDFSIGRWGRVDSGRGPIHEGQTFAQRHRTEGYTVIRRNNNWKALPRRLALSKVGSIPLPLP